LPEFTGRPVRIRFAPELRAYRGQLLSGADKGEPVHAGSRLREREIVLESELLQDPAELTRILLHELFHFVWLRASNARRRSYEDLLKSELGRGARGELGWSAERRKLAIRPRDRRERSRRWREYACESFCDTAAWVSGRRRVHGEFTLAPRYSEARRRWFEALLARGTLAW
jgi:hypothetical protein